MRTNLCLLLDGRGTVLPGWLFPLGNGAISKTELVGLCCEVLSSGFSQISFGERKPMLLSHHGHFFHKPIEQGLGRLQKGIKRHSQDHLVHLIVRLLYSRTPLESVHMGTFSNYLEKSFHIPLPHILLSPIFL